MSVCVFAPLCICHICSKGRSYMCSNLWIHILSVITFHNYFDLFFTMNCGYQSIIYAYLHVPEVCHSVKSCYPFSLDAYVLQSFTFTVNNMPGGHILVMAVVLPVRLQLSSNELILAPQGFLVKTCFRGTVRMYNHQNYFGQI